MASGFSFSNHHRNAHLSTQKQLHLPKATSTGTTIVGCLYDGGIALGADTRATEGPIVADKNCEKIHYISPSIYCCGAGTAADTEFTTALISSNIHLHSLSTGRKPRVVTAMTMLKQMLFQSVFHSCCYFLLPGMLSPTPRNFTTRPQCPSLPLASLRTGEVTQTRYDFALAWNSKFTSPKVEKELSYKYKKGTTRWTKEQVVKFDVVKEEVVGLNLRGEAMEVDG
ncbi:N-terminal nucleophile aminohydrolase [Atractiella rhizophila]|nr:N-terminal nucleophile aminohydrolase [Atractiella rhizophila]